MEEEEECKCPPVGAPGWMCTFADLSTLLLTFFVLLLSFASTSSSRASTSPNPSSSTAAIEPASRLPASPWVPPGIAWGPTWTPNLIPKHPEASRNPQKPPKTSRNRLATSFYERRKPISAAVSRSDYNIYIIPPTSKSQQPAAGTTSGPPSSLC